MAKVVGPGRARQLLLTSERVSAEAALEIGLVNQVTAAETLTEEAMAMSDHIIEALVVRP